MKGEQPDTSHVYRRKPVIAQYVDDNVVLRRKDAVAVIRSLEGGESLILASPCAIEFVEGEREK